MFLLALVHVPSYSGFIHQSVNLRVSMLPFIYPLLIQILEIMPKKAVLFLLEDRQAGARYPLHDKTLVNTKSIQMTSTIYKGDQIMYHEVARP